ncbi:MAG TPA: PKD domain-containing protein, partial [Candidatus Dormibacteraeota bacterium]|nr:PKD domain-containing protein [Candidatus Dormibacteraeota bacterium]
TWDNIASNSFSQSLTIGGYPAGKQVDYWEVATDTSGNTYEGVHHTVVVQSESVSNPQMPSGTNTAAWRQLVQFTTGGSTTTLGEVVEYQFDWGDGQQSAYGSATQSHFWNAGGTYAIRARARSQLRTGRVSDWSPPASLTVPAPVLPQLRIQVVNGYIQVSWPMNPAGFLLQRANGLATNSVWIDVPGATVIGTNYVVTESMTSPVRFYRLNN